MESLLSKSIQSVQKSSIAFTKFITANDTGATGGHQAGFHIHKSAWPLFFDSAGVKGEKKDKYITIRWQDEFETSSRFIYYGIGTRNEYRLTRFGKGFPFLNDKNIGDLLIIIKIDNDYYDAYVLNTDEDIDSFLSALNISTSDINGLIPKQHEEFEDDLAKCFLQYIEALTVDFPATSEIAANARKCYNKTYGVTPRIVQANPDKELLGWLATEFLLFKQIENNRYTHRIKVPFGSVEELIETANTILNRRKSRAGKSLEHHLEEVFRIFDLIFDKQAVIEGNKKPDFLFPNAEAYSNREFDEKKLILLAAKTTCKDRWRQILNEGDRIKTKHLFTLQQGISSNQLEEMYRYNVCLVVPKPYLTNFPNEYRDKILTLNSFIKQVRILQE